MFLNLGRRKIYEKVEIFIDNENIMDSGKSGVNTILLKEKELEIPSNYFIEPNKNYHIKIKSYYYGHDWILLENRSENIIARQIEFKLQAPPKVSDRGNYQLKIKIDNNGKVIDCSFRELSSD